MLEWKKYEEQQFDCSGPERAAWLHWPRFSPPQILRPCTAVVCRTMMHCLARETSQFLQF